MFKILAIVASIVVVISVGAGALFYFTNSNPVDGAAELTHVRGSPYYVASERALSLDPSLNALLGGNMKFGEAVLKDSDLSGDAGSVSLDLMVSGTNGSGHARVRLTRPKRQGSQPREAPWQFQGGDFFPDNGPPLHLDPR